MKEERQMDYTWGTLKDGMLAKFIFLKIDIVGHSKIVKNNPKEKVSITLDNFEKYIERNVSDFGGQLWTWQGDGGLAVFLGGNIADEAVQCAFCIINEMESFNNFKSKIRDKIAIRIAMHIGNAIYRKQTGRIHSEDINFVSQLEKECTSANDICISRPLYTELSELERQKFKRIGTFQGVQIYSKEGKIRDKVVVHVDHTDLPTREEVLTQYLHNQLRIFSTTADNYFVDTDLHKIIRDKMGNGCKIRVLLLNPNSPFMKDRERQEKTKFIKRQNITIDIIKQLKKEFPQQIELRFFDCSPTYQALIIDDYRIFVAISIYGIVGTANFPCLEITNGPDTHVLFEKFTSAFENLWKKSKRIV